MAVLSASAGRGEGQEVGVGVNELSSIVLRFAQITLCKCCYLWHILIWRQHQRSGIDLGLTSYMTLYSGLLAASIASLNMEFSLKVVFFGPSQQQSSNKDFWSWISIS